MECLAYLTWARRELHKIPELSNEEFKTSDFIAAELKKIGHKFRRVKTGIICDVAGADKKTTIALRCDIDGLPIQERSGCDFQSTNGCMHACGHDGHMAMLLQTARELAERSPKINVRLIFQCAEEGSGGAESMIEGGALDKVDSIFAFHMCPELEIGTVATSSGALFAGTVEFDVEISGKASHCANPEQGCDALGAANKFYSDSKGFNASCRGNTLFHIGKMTGGAARNIVAEKANLYCTLRFFDIVQQEAVMMNVAKSLAESDNIFKTQHRLTVGAVYPPLINSELAVARLTKACPGLTEAAPRYTAEDFAFYCEQVSGCMAWLGCRDKDHKSPLHACDFGFDEVALVKGVEIFRKLIF